MTTEGHSVKSNAAWNTVGSLVYLGCQWLITLLIVRLSSSLDDAGYLNLAISITSIFGTAASFNLRAYIISDRDGEISDGTYAGFRITTCLASFVACMVYSAFFGYSLLQYGCIAIYMAFRICEALLDFLYSFEQKRNRLDIGGKSMIARGILSVFGFTGTFVLTSSLLLSLMMMVLLSYAVMILYDYPQSKAFCSIRPRINRAFKILFRDGLFITSTSVVSDWIVTLPRQIIDSLLGAVIIGAYTTVAAPLMIIQVGISFIFNPLLPLFDERYAHGDGNGYITLLVKSLVVFVIFSAVCLVLVVLFGTELLALIYNQEVADYSYLLPTLLFIMCINAIQWYLRTLLVMVRVFIPQLIGTIGSFLLCCFITAPLLNEFGLIGANYSILICYSISFAIVLITLFITLRRHFSTKEEA